MMRFLFVVLLCCLTQAAFAQRASFSHAGARDVRSHAFEAPFGFLKMTYAVARPVNQVSFELSSFHGKSTTLLPVRDGQVEHHVRFDHDVLYTYVLRSAAGVLDSGQIEIQLNRDMIFEFSETDVEVDLLRPFDNPFNPMYYIGSQVSFSDDELVNGRPLSTTDELIIAKRQSVTVFVENVKALETERIVLDIYRLRRGRQLFIETVGYDVDPFSKSAALPYRFSKAGHYVIKAFTENDVWIENGNVVVKFR